MRQEDRAAVGRSDSRQSHACPAGRKAARHSACRERKKRRVFKTARTAQKERIYARYRGRQRLYARRRDKSRKEYQARDRRRCGQARYERRSRTPSYGQLRGCAQTRGRTRRSRNRRQKSAVFYVVCLPRLRYKHRRTDAEAVQFQQPVRRVPEVFGTRLYVEDRPGKSNKGRQIGQRRCARRVGLVYHGLVQSQ